MKRDYKRAKMKIIAQPQDFLASLEKAAHPNQSDYFALWATWLGGVVTHPPWMVIALDDHLVHRGDGVFEALKCVAGGLYLCREHLDRFRRSAEALSLEPPPEFHRLEEIMVDLIRLTGKRDCAIHLYLSRGPGDLSVNPGSCVAPGLAVLVSGLHEPSGAILSKGAKAVTAATPAKPPWMARIKSVDYLQNVMMALEAGKAGADYTFAFDGQGLLAEGPVVSVGLVTPDRALLYPRPESVFPGLSRRRIEELAQKLVAEGVLSRVGWSEISRDDLLEAQEIMVSGTMTNIVPVVELDGRPIGPGRPGPVAGRLLELLVEDIRTNAELRREVF